MKQRLADWWYHQTQVTAFRINDEYLAFHSSDLVTIDREKQTLQIGIYKWKIWKRDEPRAQWLVY